jgi:hypothetical protein
VKVPTTVLVWSGEAQLPLSLAVTFSVRRTA